MVEEIRNRRDGDIRKPELLRLESLRVVWRTPVVFDAAMDEAMMQEIQSLPCGNERRLGLILQLGTRNAAKRTLQRVSE
jgi:hypothetical protein